MYRRVTNTIKLYAKQRRLVQMVSDQIRARENNTDMLVGVLSHIVEFRNGESGSHVRHIRIITEMLLHRLLEVSSRYPLTAEQQDHIPLASALHDIGKIGIEDDFAPHFEKFKRAVEIAKKLHTTRIRMFSFYIPEGKNPEIYHDTVIERIQKMVDYGEANGVHCCHENEKGIYGDTLKRVEKLHKAIPALRCVFDPANYIQCGDDPAVNFKALAPIIDYMHIKDALFKDGKFLTQSIQTDKKFLKLAGIQVEQCSDTE